MKITRKQLEQIIKEEVEAVNELEKQGFFKRMGAKVGFMGAVKGLTKEVRKVQVEVQEFLKAVPDDERAAEQHFEEHADQISQWLTKLAEYARAKPNQVPDSSQRKHVIHVGRQMTKELIGASRRATQNLADKIKQDAERAKRAAEEAQKQKDLEAKWAAEEEAARQPKPWSQMSKAERQAAANRMDADDRAEFYDQYAKSKPTDIYQENKKITRSQLQQIIHEEYAKLNEEK